MAKKKLTLEDVLVPKEEIPYEVPENWCWVKLGSVIKVSSGKNLTKSKMNKDGTIPVYGGNGFVGYHDDFNIEESKIIIGRVGANCGNVHITDSKGWITDNAFIVSYNEKLLDKTYLYYLLSECDLGKYSNSSAQPVISGQKIYDVAIQVPPLAEQERIVKRIESLFEKVDKARKLVDEARDGFEKRRAAILEKAFSGGLTAKWREDNDVSDYRQTVLIKDVLNPMTTKKPNLENETFRYIDIDAVDNRKQEVGEPKVIDVSKAPSRASREVIEGDTLFSLVRPYLKNIAYIDKEFNDCIASTGFYVCRPNEKILSKYLYNILCSDRTISFYTNMMKGDNSPSIRKGEFESLDISLPSIEEQKEVIKIVDKLLESERSIEELCDLDEYIDMIKKSILAKAFRGELGSNNLDEESSIKLVEELIK
ncbi:restriction endonuclease subunit S [Paraclostridium sordellii]|uniref:restriction endonuclease subunit S n=1 Tax=Paraclostridium sordellii TaxID=1505 RepID=UPI0030CC558F